MTQANDGNWSHRAPPPPGWQRVPLGKVGEIASGVTLGRRLVGGNRTRRVPYLRVANVKDTHLDLSDVYEIEASEEEIQKLRLHVGDLLLTEGGDADKLGRGTLWRGELPLCIHQNHIFRVRFDPEQFWPEFIAAEIASPHGKAYFLAHAKQTTGIATINQRVLAGFPLIAPSLAEQQRIAALLQDQMAAVERARAAAEVCLEAANAVPAAFLRKAFISDTAKNWPIIRLGDVGDVVSGVTLGRTLKNRQTRRVQYLRVANVKDGHLDLKEVYDVEATYEEVNAFETKAGRSTSH
jgi:type I restriction enzyme S subunit